METVSPIRDKKTIEAMKSALGTRDKLLFIFGINSGLRISDILKLKVGDVRGMDTLTLRETKTKKAKTFRLNKSIKDAISSLIPKTAQDGDCLFPSRVGVNQPLTRVSAYRALNSAAERIGYVEPIGCHTLRKTFGYHAYNGGVDLSLLQSIFNHASQHVTLRYIGEQDDIDNVYDTINL